MEILYQKIINKYQYCDLFIIKINFLIKFIKIYFKNIFFFYFKYIFLNARQQKIIYIYLYYKL